MKYSKLAYAWIVAALVLPYLLISSPFAYTAQPNDTKRPVLPLSPIPVLRPKVDDAISRSINWKQSEYQVSDAIQVLVEVIANAQSELPERRMALQSLGTLGSALRNTDAVVELMAQYEKVTDAEEKRLLVGCLAVSNDARALPLFARFLEDATEDVSRFQGAHALARWNVRSGVAGLIKLLDSREVGPEGQRLANEVLKVLQHLNRQKGWGMNEERILQKVNMRKTGSHQVEYVAQLKNWFSDNMHRFPDWKPGDQLPENDE